MLEGWAIVDNTTGEDWTKVQLSLVSGRPISFVSQLYAPKYVTTSGRGTAGRLGGAAGDAFGRVREAQGHGQRPEPCCEDCAARLAALMAASMPHGRRRRWHTE